MNKFCRGKILTVLQRKKFNFKYFSYQLEYDLELDIVNSEEVSGSLSKTYLQITLI